MKDCDSDSSHPTPNPPPKAGDLGIFSANGRAVYDGTNVSLEVDDEELKKIWAEEVRNHGVPKNQFLMEVKALGSEIITGAAALYVPWKAQLETIPGNVRLRYIRLCICWRWICIYVWVKI